MIESIVEDFEDDPLKDTALNLLQTLQTKIEQTDREIDNMVYKLYGLSDDEVAVVEDKK